MKTNRKTKRVFLIDEEVVECMVEICDWARVYADYYKNDAPIEEDIETDAQMLNRMLPAVERFLEKPKVYKPAAKSKPKSKQELESAIYFKEKFARESVNPNYEYCVVHHSLSECWLTDDVEEAMRKARSLAICNKGIYYVLKIYQAQDKTYKTKIEFCYYENGKHIEHRDRDYLHFDFIAKTVGEENIKKITQ